MSCVIGLHEKIIAHHKMLKRLIEGGIIRDATIFGTAAIGLQIISAFRKAQTDPIFDDYPAVQSSAFFKPLLALMNILDESDVLCIIRLCDSLIQCATESESTRRGFEVNRLASEIPQTVERLIKNVSVSRDVNKAISAMDFQRDELPCMEAICDNIVRNMLLDAHPYA